jgi:hypothetical protein
MVITKNRHANTRPTRARRRPANALGIVFVGDDLDQERSFYESEIFPDEAAAPQESGSGADDK